MQRKEGKRVANEYSPTRAAIGSRIREHREARHMKGAELAVQANITAAALSNIELGVKAVKTETLIAIAEALQVSLQELQPPQLDKFAPLPASFFPLIRKLNRKTATEQEKLIKMFEAMTDIM
jgi:transcriptional regulator with XRE-family HTH domain